MYLAYSFVSVTVLALKEIMVFLCTIIARGLLELKTAQDDNQRMIQYLITRRD